MNIRPGHGHPTDPSPIADLRAQLQRAQIDIANLLEDVARAESELARADSERQQVTAERDAAITRAEGAEGKLVAVEKEYARSTDLTRLEFRRLVGAILHSESAS